MHLYDTSVSINKTEVELKKTKWFNQVFILLNGRGIGTGPPAGNLRSRHGGGGDTLMRPSSPRSLALPGHHACFACPEPGQVHVEQVQPSAMP
jgi:hypothetical protein